MAASRTGNSVAKTVVLAETPHGSLVYARGNGPATQIINWKHGDASQWIYLPRLSKNIPDHWQENPPQSLLEAFGPDWKRTVAQLARLAGIDAKP